MFAGMTLFEHGMDRSPVWINDSAHWINCAMTGSGKFTTSLAMQAILHPGSAVFISPKPEIADFALGRRVDPKIFADHEERKPRSLGVDPRKISQTEYHVPGSRSFLLDPYEQSVYPSNQYNPLAEVDLRRSNARSRLLAIAAGSFPDKKSKTDPWFTHAPRGLLAAGCAHVMLTDPNPANHTLSAAIDMLMGIDPRTGFASATYFESVLAEMMKNNGLDGFIQACAANISQLGERAFGNIYSEFETNCRWATDGSMRRHLRGPSDFSFSELGDDRKPATVFVVPPRGAKAFQASIAWLRTIAELSLEVFSTRTNVGRVPVLWCGDEYKSWGQEVDGVRNGFTLLRDKKVKLTLYTQSWEQLEEMFGGHGAAELESCSTMQYFGCNDLATAERIRRRLGRHVVCDVQGWLRREKAYREADLVTTAEVMQELRSSSNLQYVFPSNSLPIRLERVAFKRLRANDGGKFSGLPLAGHYDEGLSKPLRR